MDKYVEQLGEGDEIDDAIGEYAERIQDVGVMPGYMTLATAANMIGVEPSSLRHRIRKGVLLAQRVGAKMWVVKVDDILALDIKPRRKK